MTTQPLTFGADKQATGIKKSRVQNATDLQQITANEACGTGSYRALKKSIAKATDLQQISIGIYPCKPM